MRYYCSILLEDFEPSCNTDWNLKLTVLPLGKQVIHPAQIDVVNQAFSPTKEQIEYAEGLVEAFDAHQKSGKVCNHCQGLKINAYLKNSILMSKNIDKEQKNEKFHSSLSDNFFYENVIFRIRVCSIRIAIVRIKLILGFIIGRFLVHDSKA